MSARTFDGLASQGGAFAAGPPIPLATQWERAGRCSALAAIPPGRPKSDRGGAGVCPESITFAALRPEPERFNSPPTAQNLPVAMAAFFDDSGSYLAPALRKDSLRQKLRTPHSRFDALVVRRSLASGYKRRVLPKMLRQ